jgi:uncharacterized membrane protein YccC
MAPGGVPEDPTTAAGVGAAAWLRRRDPGLVVVRRAARVTIAACAGFYGCRYLLGDTTTAVYAVFATISLGALSQVTGPPAQRTRTYLGAFGVAVVLVSLGTWLAVSTWAAVAGMLVIGFAVAFSGTFGPRAAGVSSGLQLFYVLPCFPPYAPDELPARLAGIAVGVALLAVADRLLWPEPGPRPFSDRLAATAEDVARYAAALRTATEPTARPGALADPALAALRDAASRSAEALRLTNLPVAERPTGPGARDRSLLHAAAAVRVVAGRLTTLADLLAARGTPPASTATADLVGAVGEALTEAAAALRGTGPPPSVELLDAAVEHHSRRRAARLAADHGPRPALRSGITAAAIAEAARTAVLATRGALGLPAPDAAALPPALWFLHASRARLWWRRMRLHLTPRSVVLQNAVRLALGLAVARAVAGVFDLSHGFWVLLATLSLMRTSAVASRAALVRAVAGTVVGALLAGALLAVVGDDAVVYAFALPLTMVVAFTVGPLLGLAAAQAGFTVTVALLFVQVAPAGWELAEVRLLDVVVGGLVGTVIGAAVWPRGGGGEIRHAAAAGLSAGADEIVATTRFLVGRGPGEVSGALGRGAGLLDQAYAQYRSEPSEPSSSRDWLVVLGVVHRIDGYARTLRIRHPDPAPPPWPDVTARLDLVASEVARAYRGLASSALEGAAPADLTSALRLRLSADHLHAAFGEAPDAALAVFDGWAWLHGLVDDLARAQTALAPAAAEVPGPPSRMAAAGGGRDDASAT